MDNPKKIIIDVFLILLISLTIYFAIVWFSSDNSGEAGFAILTVVFIPILSYLRKQFKEKNIIEPISIKINSTKIRCYTKYIDYAIQLDIEIYTKQKISLKKIYITFKEAIGYSEDYRTISDFPLYINNKDDLLQYEPKIYKEILQKKETISNLPIVINELEHKIFTISTYIEGERLPDGWEGLNLNEWYLYIEYNEDKIYKEKLLFEIHQDSIKEPSEYKNVGFVNR